MSSSQQPCKPGDGHDKALPDVALKWGRSPPDPNGTSHAIIDPKTGKPMDWENFYSEEEKEKLRKKGFNPALKAEMEYRQTHAEGRGIWMKVMQTAFGGGWIK